jgi:TatD DNase family protein
MFDAHAHLQDPRLEGLLPGLLEAAGAAGIRGACCCATRPGDMAATRSLPENLGGIRVLRGYGVHPWHAAEFSTGGLEAIEAALGQDPSACVGEIGLDGIRKEVPAALQREVLVAQLELATRARRVVVLHGARAR